MKKIFLNIHPDKMFSITSLLMVLFIIQVTLFNTNEILVGFWGIMTTLFGGLSYLKLRYIELTSIEAYKKVKDSSEKKYLKQKQKTENNSSAREIDIKLLKLYKDNLEKAKIKLKDRIKLG